MHFFILVLGTFDSLWLFLQLIRWGVPSTLQDLNAHRSLGPAEFFLQPLQANFFTCGIYLTILLTMVRYIAISQKYSSVIEKRKVKIYIACVIFFSFIWNFPKWFALDEEGYHKDDKVDPLLLSLM